MKLRVLLFCIYFLSNLSHASFGLGPCCSGFPCGIIPCDSSCAGSAFNSMGSDVQRAINDTETAYRDYNDALDEQQSNIESLLEDASDTINQNAIEYVRLIDTAAKANSALLEAKQKITTEGLGEFLTKSIAKGVKDRLLAEIVTKNNHNYSEVSQPVSLDVEANAASDLKVAKIKASQLKSEQLNDISTYLYGAEAVANSAKGLSKKISDSTISDYNITPLITKESLSDQENRNVQFLLSILTEMAPFDHSLIGHTDGRIYFTKLLFAVDGFLEILSNKSSHANVSVDQHYAQVSPQNNGLTSISEKMNANVTGKVANSKWYAGVKLLSKTGLRRELSGLETRNDEIMQRTLHLSQKSTHLYSVLLVEKSKGEFL